MIRLPQTGIEKSVRQHNSDLMVACDWLESWVLFCDEEVSWSDVRDILLEQQLYRDQDFADELLTSIWRELRQRSKWLGRSSPFKVQRERIEPVDLSYDPIAQKYMLVVSLGPKYSRWTSQFGTDYRAQGEIFERLVEDAVTVLFPGWNVHRTGWSSSNAVRLADVVSGLAEAISATMGDVGKWAGERANECGLDLVWYRPFSDSRPAVPIYLAQCASGGNWTTKLGTPNLDIWIRLLDFPQKPGLVFTIPFALNARDHVQRSLQGNAILLDRYRLLHAGLVESGWQSASFQEQAEAWLQPRVEWMLED